MLNPTSGDLLLDSGEMVGSHAAETDFLNLNVGKLSRMGTSNANYRWYLATTEIGGRPWRIQFGFKNARLEFISMTLADPSRSWETFSEAVEVMIAKDIQKQLQDWLGRTANQNRHGVDQYFFDWGGVSAGVVPQDATASIAIQYNESA